MGNASTKNPQRQEALAAFLKAHHAFCCWQTKNRQVGRGHVVTTKYLLYSKEVGWSGPIEALLEEIFLPGDEAYSFNIYLPATESGSLADTFGAVEAALAAIESDATIKEVARG